MVDFSAWQPALLVMVFTGLGLMGAGFLWRDRRAHWLRAAGWTLFALYWPFQAPEFFHPVDTEPDPINGWFTLLGPIFLLWIAWHEIKSYRWREDPEALRWFTGASFVSALTYFVIYEIPAVQKWLIYQTAIQSSWMLSTIFGVPNGVVQDSTGDAHIFLNGGTEYAVTVILACTAIQSIMIFVGAIACLRASSSRKWKAYAITVPVIYVLNLFRNAGIVYGYKVLGWGMFGIDPFEWMHSYVGKIGSLVAMVFIALGVFALLPELHSNILDLFDLRKRKHAGFFSKPPPPPPSKVDPAPAPTDA
ncbi:MAG TPA: archaeosortase A [Candidatus Thermoplasmatota archaeon]|nr:archaeosortase A [Candidatus Thermoplasmatota archaeon]